MKRKQYVYVLIGNYNYEGSTVLGVFRSRRGAEKYQAVCAGYDDYDILREQVL